MLGAPRAWVVEFLTGDVSDPEFCGRITEGVSVVFHVAALPSVPRSLAGLQRTWEGMRDGSAGESRREHSRYPAQSEPQRQSVIGW